ncbi:hypothetical protein [Haloarcula montana]|uniref:hypothetical protein n=1 Tax=Haloarcula montana TaxID=3111776 RepID=UPI002D76CDC8|nr:hypothetical protein [Haloarcula sp. GH36]
MSKTREPDTGEIDEEDLVNVGGKEPNGKPAAIGRWTFQTKKVRDELLSWLEGRVLNAFAGKTRLSDYKNGIEEVRNDLNPERDADYHVDAVELGQMFDENTFDVVVLDPPFDQTQSDELYDGLHARDMGDIRRAVAPLVKPGGRIVEFGWDMWGASDYFDLWSREHKRFFRRAMPGRHPILMTVDKKTQMTLSDTGGKPDE